MIFEKIRWKNLFSYGKKWTDFPLNTNESINIIGDNGNGKSVLIEALYFALTGKPFRKCAKSTIVNFYNKKDCLVELTVCAGKHRFMIRRGVKPNVFLIFKNLKMADFGSKDEPLDEASIMTDTQTYLETVLGFTKKNLKHTLIMSTTDYMPFLRLPAADKRLFIEDILSIEIFSVMNKLVKSKLSILKDEIKDNTTDIDKLQYKLNMILEYNRQQQETNDDEIAEQTQKIIDEKSSLSKTITDIKLQGEKTDSIEHKALADNIEKAEETAAQTIDNERKKLGRDIEDLKVKAKACKQELAELKAKNQILAGLILDAKADHEDKAGEKAINENVLNMNTLKYENDSSKYEKNLKKGDEAEYKARHKLKEKQSRYGYYTITDECTQCEQSIERKFKQKQLDDISNEITKLKIKHGKIKSELGKLDNFKKRIEKFKLDKITPFEEKIAELDIELLEIRRNQDKDEAETKVIYHQGIAAKKQMAIFREGRDKLKDDADARIAVYEDIEGAIKQMKTESAGRISDDHDVIKSQIDREKKSAAGRITEAEKKIDDLSSQEKGKLKDEDGPRREVDAAGDRKKSLAFKKLVHDVTIAILSDKGIKTYIIKRYIPKLNKMVNQYLEILSASYKLSFDEELEEKIALKGYEKLSYNNFSEGERQRCDIALLFAFLDIGKMKNSVTSNLLLMDEVVDRSLDDDGIRGIINIIDSMKAKGFTIVNISHKHQLADKFDVTYRAIKDKFSNLESL